MTRYSSTMTELCKRFVRVSLQNKLRWQSVLHQIKDKGGNMTGAVTPLKKSKRGLSDHEEQVVQTVLKRQNEDLRRSNKRSSVSF